MHPYTIRTSRCLITLKHVSGYYFATVVGAFPSLQLCNVSLNGLLIEISKATGILFSKKEISC